MAEELKAFIREIPDFPRPGIIFKDIAPLLGDAGAFRKAVDCLAAICEAEDLHPDVCAGPEARGFIFASALAYRLGLGFVPIRKPGKLPHQTSRIDYDLEYGTNAVEMHVDAVKKGQRVLIVDDVLATGGTVAACKQLVEGSGGCVAGALFVVELRSLGGAARLEGVPMFSVLRY
jgi:adenine phosphoribosyltransferase